MRVTESNQTFFVVVFWGLKNAPTDFDLTQQNKENKMNKNNWINELQVGTKSKIITNPYNNKSMELNPLEIAVYDFIKGCEFMGMNVPMSWGISWFIDNNPKAYQILLD